MRKLVYSVVGILVLLNVVALGESRYMEAEEFDGLPYYGNWRDIKGWYTKRHYHASGGAFVCVHYPGAKMYKRLAKPLPMGAYDVYLKICSTRSANTKNVMKVSLGRYGVNGQFSEVESDRFVQDFAGNGYGWFKLGRKFAIGDPCDVIRVEAVTVENMGIGDDPELAQPYIIFDGLIVTDEKVQLTEDRRKRNKIKFLTGDDPRAKVARPKYPTATIPIHTENVRKSGVFLSKRNLLRNSSFELSLKPHFAGGGNTMTSGDNVDADNLCTENPFHGKYCLELAPNLTTIVKDYEGSDEKQGWGRKIDFVALKSFLGKEVEALSKKPGLVFSYYLRTNGKEVRVGGRAVSHKDWRRYSELWHSRFELGFVTDDPEARVWIDALQLERGRTPGKYTPLEGLEAGFQTRAKSNIFYNDGPMELEFSVAQAANGKEKITARYSILNTHLETAYKGGSVELDTAPGGVATKKVTVPFLQLGSYLLVYDVDGHPEQGYAVPVFVVENPAKRRGKKRALGAIISTNEETMKIFSHAGFDWVNSLNDRLVYFNYVWPADDDMRFFPKHLKKWEEKYGIQYAYWRPPFNPPRWTDNPVGKEAAAHMGGVNIGRDAWDQFWSEATKKLGFIKVWMPTDEQSYHRGPRESIPYIEIAAKHIRKNIPDAIIMNSSQSFHLYQMLKLKPDLDIGDAIGGSRHGFERNSYFYDRCVKDMTGKEFWSVAVGWIVPSWHQVLNYESMDLHKNYGARFAGRNNTVAASLFNEAAIIGVERFGLYSAKFDKGRDPFSLFTSDGTIKPFGIQFINTINFLRGHKRGGIIDLDSAYGVYCSYLYREGRVCAMLMPDGAYDEVVVNLDMPGDKVQVYDFNLNPITFSKRVVLPPSKCIFVEDRGLGGDKLLAALKALKAYPEGMERRLVLPAGDGVELAAYKMQKGKMTRLAATALPKDAGLKYPIDQARYGRNQAWATVAPRRRVGRELGHKDFQGSAPSFIYCWHALDGSSGALQGIRNFGSVFSLSDISATFKTMNDGENVFFSFEILDDDRQPGDKLVLKIDADLLGDLSEAQPNADDYTVTVSFDPEAPMAPVILRNSKGKSLRGCGAQIRMLEDGYSVILRVSLSAIGVPGNTPCSLGLGVELVDADKNEKETVLRWTSNYAPGNSPFGLGQLVLLGK